jgi:hypothetical protein
MELQLREHPTKIAEEAVRLANRLHIFEKIWAAGNPWIGSTEREQSLRIIEKIDAELGKLKFNCLCMCMTNSDHHRSSVVLHMLEEIKQLSSQFPDLNEQTCSFSRVSSENYNRLVSVCKYVHHTRSCLMRISREFYAWQ